jgi:heme a synthase
LSIQDIFSPHLRATRRILWITVGSVLFLIWIGGFVRATGSGMGCPDWPKCFGLWAPPTCECSLPKDYKEIYIQKRLAKNARIAKMLRGFGALELADRLEHDESIKVETTFDPLKAWIEYVNRLIGVLVGGFIILSLLATFRTRKKYKSSFWMTFAAFLLVLFQGWLGSVVVSSNLLPGLITVHMVVALVILMLLVSAVLRTYRMESSFSLPKNAYWLGFVLLLLYLAQIIMGSQVREGIDIVSKQLGEAQRGEWVEHLPAIYNIHKYFYYLLAALTGYWFFLLKSYFMRYPIVKKLIYTIVIALVCEIVVGISMHRFAIPPIFQPLHLIFATGIFSAVYILLSCPLNRLDNN